MGNQRRDVLTDTADAILAAWRKVKTKDHRPGKDWVTLNELAASWGIQRPSARHRLMLMGGAVEQCQPVGGKAIYYRMKC